MENKGFINNNCLETFSSLQKSLSGSIETLKQEYFLKIAKKLSDPAICSKPYWSILKSILMGKKVCFATPIFHENKFLLT